MCGIAGFNWSDKRLAKSMADSISYRGPDQDGYFSDKSVSLGHRRLSILDLSEKGKQPMRFKDYVIVFNGEIYNYLEIREELEKKGHRFVSTSDTEVMLHSYDEWGQECVKRFNGMWAFCIYDSKKGILFLSRDRFGEKPLYYYIKNGKFIFSSELKAIRKHKIKLELNKTAINNYFYQKYIGGELTIFNDCFKLRPSECMIFDLANRSIRRFRYYDLEKEIEEQRKMPLNERLASIQSLLNEAVEKRLVADVPVGSFLSGGVDSSLISAIIAKKHKDFNTFSIGFKEESFDELPYSKIAADYIKTKHNYRYMDIDEDMIKHVIGHMDEPFGDSSILPTFLLSKMTREKVTVALSGDAGDEVFGGYDTYKGYKIAKYVPRFILKISKYAIDLLPPSEKKLSLSFKMKRFVGNFENNIVKRHLDWMATFDERSRANLLGENLVKDSEITDIEVSDGNRGLLDLQLNDIHNYLAEDILKKVDLASMLNSLESRIPFLDPKIVPLVLSLPEKYKIRCFRTKWLLKKIASRYLPHKIVCRKKRGFTVPVSSWIKGNGMMKEYLTERRYFRQNYLNYAYVQQLYQDHISNKKDNSRELWLVFVFNYWLNNIINGGNFQKRL